MVSFLTGEIISDVERAGSIPGQYSLSQNYPNPFSAGSRSAFGGNPTTSISFRLPTGPPADATQAVKTGGVPVTLKVYDLLGREVATLVSEVKNPGIYTVRWNAINVPSGVYFYTLRAGSFVDTKRLVLMK